MKTRIGFALFLICLTGCGNCNLFRRNKQMMQMAPMQQVQCVPVQCVPVQTVAPQVCPEPTVGPTF